MTEVSGTPSGGQVNGSVSEEQRQRALDRLREDYERGWLSPDEHELRTTMARRASTQAELDASIKPGPIIEPGAVERLGPISPVPPLSASGAPLVSASSTGSAVAGGEGGSAGAGVVPAGSSAVVPAGEAKSRGLIPVPEHVASGLVGLTPFIAMAGFFLGGFNWLWFLLIPVAGIVFGSGVPSAATLEKRRLRHERRMQRRLSRGEPPIPGETLPPQ